MKNCAENISSAGPTGLREVQNRLTSISGYNVVGGDRVDGIGACEGAAFIKAGLVQAEFAHVLFGTTGFAPEAELDNSRVGGGQAQCGDG